MIPSPYVTIGLVMALAASIMANYTQHQEAKLIKTRVLLAESIQAKQAANALTEASEVARRIERQTAATTAAISEAYEKGKTDAKANSDRLIADLNGGSRRLRAEWGQCETARLSSAVAAASQSDDAARWRNSSAGRIIGAADEDAAKIIGLQNLLRAEREPHK